LQLRVVGGFLLLVTFFALVFEVVYIATHPWGHDPLDDFDAAMDVMAYPIWHLVLMVIAPFAILLLAGALSALAGKHWSLCILACICAMASVLVHFYYTAIMGTTALIFIAQSRGEFLDLRRNPLPASGDGRGAGPEGPGHSSCDKLRP